jgi:hypothetical protein
MKNRDVVVGVVLVALIAAGVYLVRSRSAPSEVPAGQSATPAGEQVRADEALPDVTLTDAFVDVADVRVTLSLTPKPPVVLETFRVRVSAFAVPAAARTTAGAAAADEALPIENGRVSFEMVMPMGDHRYALAAGEAGWQEATVVLPT